jgi:hypothetical protein
VGYFIWPKEAAMPAHPAHTPHGERPAYDLADMVEDFGFALMFFSGAAIALTVVVLLLVF